jgi:hypothetical protein
MLDQPPSPRDLQAVFQQLFNLALTLGRIPPATCGLGSATLAAINAIAREHPEAVTQLVTDAYDAFKREHGRGR